MNEIEKKKISKFLSLILRHSPQNIGLKLDKEGWADVNELISKSKKYKITKIILEEVVATNDKQRFSFNDKKTKIRANQGHSIDIELNLDPVQPPDFLYHGTAQRYCKSIKEEGIKNMSRQYVHLSKDKETADKVGSRHGKPKILTIMSGQMYKDGISFYLSKNGVWLTEYVDPKYISK